MKTARNRVYFLLFAFNFLAFTALAKSDMATVTFSDFEQNMQGWEIPFSSSDSKDYVAKTIRVNRSVASSGSSSLEVVANFKNGAWSAAMVDAEESLAIRSLMGIECSIFLPETAPKGLSAKFVIVTSDDYQWYEMKNPVSLKPGKWNELKCSMTEGDCKWDNLSEPCDSSLRDYDYTDSIGIKIESNGTAYAGSIYIDNIRLIQRRTIGHS